MIKSVHIKNLRGIREGKLEDLSPLTILVGPNGCGKSTILDALSIGAHPVPPQAIADTVARRIGGAEGARWLFWRADHSRSVDISLSTETETRSRILKCKAATKEGAVKLHVDSRVPDYREPPTTIAFSATGDCQFNRVLEGYTEIVPAVRFVQTDASDGQPLHSLFSRAVEQGRREQGREILKSLIPGVENIEILTAGPSPVLHVVFRDYSVPVALAGDGIHAVLRLVLELAAQPGGVVLVEEPELHQHPGAIFQSAQVICAATRRDLQIVLSTHSLELIDAILENATEDDLDRLSLFRLNLRDGELISARVAGPEVARVRHEIEDDLR